MAKKNKDDIENNDELNDGRSEDINNADDNFGLPDVEYTPVDREEEEKPVSETHEETTRPSRSEYIAASGAAAGSQARPGYTRYSPPPRESNAPKIIILLIVLLAVALGLWYFGFYAPEQKLKAEKEQQETLRKEEAERQRQAQIERERLEREESQREADRLAAETAAATPSVGTTETISSRTGRYYVIVASALDEDLANDYAKKLNEEGKSIKILKPAGNNKFHRVAVGDFDSWASAETEAKELKGTYGEGVWVVKF